MKITHAEFYLSKKRLLPRNNYSLPYNVNSLAFFLYMTNSLLLVKILKQNIDPERVTSNSKVPIISLVR